MGKRSAGLAPAKAWAKGLVVLLVLAGVWGGVAGPVWAGEDASSGKDFEKAMALYDQKKYKEALPILTRLAEQGYTPAQSFLGGMYEKGQGVAQDYTQAMDWTRNRAITPTHFKGNPKL